jgi:hypothetical protein
MKKYLMIGATLLSLTACTSTQQGATVGAVAGGVVGAATTGTVLGTAVGAGVGAVAGAVVGKVAGEPEKCYYRNSNGDLYIDTCPQG